MTLEHIKFLRQRHGCARQDYKKPSHFSKSYSSHEHIIHLLWLLDRLYIEQAYVYGRSFADITAYEDRIKPKEPNPDLIMPQAEDS